MKLRAECPAERGWDRREFLRELIDRVAQAGTKTCPREQRPHTAGRAVEAIGQDASDAIARLLGERRTLEHLVGLGKSYGTVLRCITEMPEYPATDNRGQVDLLGETVTVLLVSQEIGGQRQPTPRQDRDQTVLTEGTDQTVERHGGEMVEDRAQIISINRGKIINQ